MGVPLAFLAGVGAVFFLAGTAGLRRGLALLLVWMVLEDTVRKLLPGQPAWVILGKDVALVALYLSTSARALASARPAHRQVEELRRSGLWSPPFLWAVKLLAAACLLQCVNSTVPNVWVALAGLRSYLWYVPVAWLGYECSKTEDEAVGVVRWLAALAPVLLAMAAVQMCYDPHEMPLLGAYEQGHQYHTFGRGGVRLTTSFFGSHARFARMALGMCLLSLGMATHSGLRIVAWGLAAAAAAGCVFISGCRAVFSCLALMTLAYAVVTRRLSRAPRYALGGAGVAGVLCLYAPDIVNFLVSAAEDAPSRVSWMGTQVEVATGSAGMLGYGMGTSSQGLGYVPGGPEFLESMGRPETWGPAEQGLGKVICEMGLVGFAVYLVFWGAVLSSLVRCALAVPDGTLKGVAWGAVLSVASVLALSMVHAQLLGDAHTLVLMWFLVGFTHRLPTLGRRPAGRALVGGSAR